MSKELEWQTSPEWITIETFMPAEFCDTGNLLNSGDSATIKYEIVGETPPGVVLIEDTGHIHFGQEFSGTLTFRAYNWKTTDYYRWAKRKTAQ